MDVFYHNLYEFQKGLRNMSLCTLRIENRQKAEQRLQKESIAYLIHDIGCGKINIYFGDQACIDIIRSFNKQNLSDLSPEQDFILGIMLGYNRLKQCERYLRKKQKVFTFVSS